MQGFVIIVNIYRYFVVRPSTGSANALDAAMSHPCGIWSFPSMTERRLMAATSGGETVIAIFSVQHSGAVQGAAVFTGEQQTQGGRSGVMMKWMLPRDRQPVMMSCLQVRVAERNFSE